MKRSAMRLLSGLMVAVLALSTPDMGVLAATNESVAVVTDVDATVSGNDLADEEAAEEVSEESAEEAEAETEADEAEAEEEYVSFWENEIWNEDLDEEEFMERLAAIEIDPEVDPEGYQAWKDMLTGSGMMLMALTEQPSNNIIGNDYVEIWANDGYFTIGTTGGNPELSSDNNKKMIYGHPNSQTSYTTIRVGGQTYKYSASNGTFDTEKKSYISSNVYNGIKVTQEIKIVNNKSTERNDVVQIKYTAENTSSSAVTVGARIMLDTMLGSNDAAPFKIPGVGSVTSEREYVGSAIPKYWQAFDSLTNPGTISQGRFIIEGYDKPDKVQFTNWGHVYTTDWNYTVSPTYSNGDSAVSAIWNEKSLAAGEAKEFVTYYGLSEFEGNLLPPLALAVATDAVMTYSGNSLPQQDVMSYIQNISGATATNVKASIELPSGLKLVRGNATVELGTLFNNVERQMDWKIALDTTSPKASYTIKVKVTADGCADKVVSKNIKVEVEGGKKAIIVVPGIAGTRLFSNEDVETKNYLPSAYNVDKHHFKFNAGHQFWEPYTSTVSNMLQSATTQQNKIQSEVMMLICDNNGASKISISPETPNRDSIKGAQGTYTKLVNDLTTEYGADYDVKFLGYDWRMSVSDAAASLENYINTNGYSDVILVCHSMGGLVASKYLTRSSENQTKVNKLITIGTPYLGAPKALYVLETGHLLNWAQSTFCMATPIKEVANNFDSVYQLLPTQNYFDLNDTTYVQYQNNNGFWGRKKTYKYDYAQTKNLINGRSWASGKRFVGSAEAFASTLFVNGSHITNTVDSYYVIGYGKDTILEVEEEFNKDGSFDSVHKLTVTIGGDQTVPMISANIGGTADPDKTFYINDTHTGMVENKNVITLIKNIINGEPDNYPTTFKKTMPTSLGFSYIQVKIECPVDLAMVDEDGNEWAYVSPEIIYNDESRPGSFYVYGKDNDSKLAILEDELYNLKLLGTDEGTMTYTLSVFTDDNEVRRVVFEDVAITKTMVITTDTDYANGLVLNVDEDGDGVVDYQIYPTRILEQNEITDDDDEFSLRNVSAITSDKGIGMQINGTDVKVTKAVLADGTCNFYTGKDVVIDDENNSIAKLYQNGTLKQTSHEGEYADVKEILDDMFANKADVMPKGANTYGTTAAFYNITAPITDIVTEKSIVLSTQKLSSKKDCLVYSKEGSVSAYLSDMDFDGVIYAPNGTVTIYGSNIHIHGTIIAEKIVINGQNVLFD